MGSLHIADPQRHHPAPRLAVAPDKVLSRTEVERRMLRAIRTIRVLPDKETSYFSLRNSMPPYVREAIDAYNSDPQVTELRFVPSPFDVSDCLLALSWARHLSLSDWRILTWRAFELSFGQIAHYIGRSDETARRRYGNIITDVWATANNLVPSWAPSGLSA